MQMMRPLKLLRRGARLCKLENRSAKANGYMQASRTAWEMAASRALLVGLPRNPLVM